MAFTYITNVFDPEVWLASVREDFSTKSALAQSGVLAMSPLYNEAASGKAKKVSIPFLTPLTGDMEILAENTALTAANITGGEQEAYKLLRGRLIGNSDLASAVTGDDILGYIRSIASPYMIRERQKALINSMTGVFATALTSNVNDISAEAGSAALVTSGAIADTGALIGDNMNDIALIAMHSAVVNKLRKDGVIVETAGVVNSQIPTENALYLNNARVIMDDSLAPTLGVYPIMMFGQGSIAFGSGAPMDYQLLEDYRDAAKSEGGIVVRDCCIIHPQGMSFTGTPGSSRLTPNNTDLATGSNWTRKFAAKNCKYTMLKARVAVAES